MKYVARVCLLVAAVITVACLAEVDLPWPLGVLAGVCLGVWFWVTEKEHTEREKHRAARADYLEERRQHESRRERKERREHETRLLCLGINPYDEWPSPTNRKGMQ